MDISQKISEKNLLGFGSNRIVFDIGDGKVLKVPYNNIGLDSNKLEYEYYLKKPNIVAKIYSYENNLIIQEKLTNVVTVPYVHTVQGTVKQYLEEKGIQIDNTLLEEILNTKVQIGTDANGNWKFFDYEDAKFMNSKDVPNSFRMKNEDLNQFWNYTNGKNVEKIDKKCTFEDYFKNKTRQKD